MFATELFPKTWALLTSRLSASSSLLNPVGRGEAVVISMTYKSVLRLLQSLPILSQREPRTIKLKRRVSNPRLIFKNINERSHCLGFHRLLIFVLGNLLFKHMFS